MTNMLPTDYQYKRDFRNFVQFGGPSPTNELRYQGRDTTHIMIGDVTRPNIGGVDTHWNFSDTDRGGFELAGYALTAPGGLPETDVTIREKPGKLSILRSLRGSQMVSFYTAGGECGAERGNPNAWTTKVRVHCGAIVRDTSANSLTAFDGDDAFIEDTVAVTFLGGIYDIAPLSFSTELTALTTREALDVVYGDMDCFSANPDGTRWRYVLRAGAVGTAPDVLYRTDLTGAAGASAAITGAATAEVAKAIRVVGSRILVLTEAGLYVGTLSTTGVPGTFTKVTTGLTLPANAPQDLYVISGQEVFAVGNAGYIYKSSDPLAGFTAINPANSVTGNLTRIHGARDLIVAVGAAGAVVYSTDRGANWSVGAAPSANGLTAVCVLPNGIVWVGDSTGAVYYSRDRMQSWTQKTLDAGGTAITAIQDIKAPTHDVIYIAGTTATPTARIFSTYSGGYSIVTSHDPRFARFATLSTFNRANRLAFPNVSSREYRANYLTIAGLATGGTLGVVYSGNGPFV